MGIHHNNLTPDQERQVERLLATANLFRMRGQLMEAEDKCREVLAIDPNDISTREILSDILYDCGKLDQALEEIRTAVKMSPNNPSVEKKFAKLTLAVAEREREKAIAKDMLDNPHKYTQRKRDPAWALVWASIPGMGQFYNGDMAKAYMIWAVTILFFFSWLIPHKYPASIRSVSEFIYYTHWAVQWTFVLAFLAYIYGLIDAPVTAAKTAKAKEKKPDPLEELMKKP